MPCASRAPINTAMVGASAPSAQPAPYSTVALRNMRRIPQLALSAAAAAPAMMAPTSYREMVQLR